MRKPLCPQRLWMGILCLILACGCANSAGVFQPAVSKLMDDARQLQQAGHKDQALSRMEAAASLVPGDYAVQYDLGVLYSDDDRWAEAIQHLSLAVQASPDKPDALYSLGLAYQALGDQLSAPHKGKPGTVDAALATQTGASGLTATAAYAKALEIDRHYLQVAPSGDAGRQTVQTQVELLQKRQAAPAASVSTRTP